jgi:hypothetical protein
MSGLPIFSRSSCGKADICTEYLERWVRVRTEIKMKERIIILGYSLSVGDERFKERIRKVIGKGTLSWLTPTLRPSLAERAGSSIKTKRV